MRLRNEPLFQGITLPLDDTIKLTAYADDVNLYVTQSSDINIINSILSTYQSVSNWVSDILYLRKSQGGLGLVHILSRLHAFRLRFIHEYLYYDRHSCFRIANVFLEEFITLDILNSYSFLCL